MADNILHITDLKVNFGSDTIISNFNMTLKAGEIVCILGHNGSGKSTLLNAIYGLLPAVKGSILFNGLNITGYSVSQRSAMGIGYLPQDNNLFKHLTVKQHIQLALSANRKQDYNSARENIMHYITTFPDIELKKAGFLSGGERRKLGLAMLITQGANQLWLFDEPSAGVDKKGVSEIFDCLKLIIKMNGISIILVEQNQILGKMIATQILTIEK